MNDYKKVYKDAVKVHDMVERVKKSRKAALDNINSDWVYLDPDEKEFVKNAIIAAYEPRIDNLLKKFCTVYEENNAATEIPKGKTYYEFDFQAYKITVDSDMFYDARYKCAYTDVNCNNCVLNDIPCICNELQDRYRRGEYRILNSKEDSDETDN